MPELTFGTALLPYVSEFFFETIIFVEKLTDILFDKSTKSSMFNKSDEE